MSKKWLWLLIIPLLLGCGCGRQPAEPNALEQRREEVIQALWSLDNSPTLDGDWPTDLLGPRPLRILPETGVEVWRDEVVIWVLAQPDLERELAKAYAYEVCHDAVKLLIQLGLNPREQRMNISVNVIQPWWTVTGQKKWRNLAAYDYEHIHDSILSSWRSVPVIPE